VTTSFEIPELRYGTVNADLIGKWHGLDPAEDGPFYALNLMAYRDVADYGDASGPRISGREADDRYAPIAPLAAVGASIVLFADVSDQRGAAPSWDRVAIVRYPTRAAFLEMNESEEFQRLHVHKEAGMRETILASCVPAGPSADAPGSIVLRVVKGASQLAAAPGAARVATFDVEGIVIGDGRTFDRVALDACEDAAAVASSMAADAAGDEHFAIALGRPIINQVAASIVA